jgi:hypothetical protein
MPLKNRRLDRVVRKKLRRLLFQFYEILQREGTPPRFAQLLVDQNARATRRARSPSHPPKIH